MINSKTLLSGLSSSELSEYVVSIGIPKYRAAQLSQWLCRGASFDEMLNLPKELRSKFAENAVTGIPEISRKLVSKLDGTIKYLFKLSDGNHIESVVMRYKHGLSICVSSQVGCRMGCAFCASTIGGLVRSLEAGEILGQIIAAQRDIGERISHVVMMGIGEPLDNFDNVVKFLSLVTSPDSLNIGARNISLSTCGIIPRIDELSRLGYQITLSISLHSADDGERSSLMPVNKKYPLSELLSACRRYFDVTGRRISFEYTLIEGKNDSPESADRLASLLRSRLGNIPFHVNLIPVNPVRESGFTTVTRVSADNFAQRLALRHVNATVRRTLGGDISASCGQLRQKEENITLQ
ncbi:MAG: 23S rRNA (adenine(2503)-C(2))-methyltransferase RlmN [Eubacteriales bacterium]